MAGCGRLAFDPQPDDVVEPDAADACAVERMNLGRFGIPRLITQTASPAVEDDPILSSDGLELYFASNRPDAVGGEDIYVTRRANRSDPWGTVERVANLSSDSNDNTPAMSSDGLEMWVVSDRAGSIGGEDIWVSVRSNPSAPWPLPTLVRELSSTQLDRGPAPYANDLRMVLHTNRPGGKGNLDFFESARSSRNSMWQAPVPLTSVNTSDAEIHAWMSPCGLQMFFQANRGGMSGMDFYTASRGSLDEDFGPEQRVDELSTAAYDQDIHVSRDLRTVVFSSDISGNGELYEATR